MDDWRENSGPLLTKLQFLLESQKLADVKFVVGEEKRIFFAHRLILAANSMVFEAMLYGKLAEEDDIYITDVDVNSFESMLRYFYTDSVTPFESVEDALNLCYAATKYMVKVLRETSEKYILEHLTPENVCTIHELADKMRLCSVVARSRKMFSHHTREVIDSENFLSASVTVIEDILDIVQHNVPSEAYVFEAVLQWGQQECVRERHEDLRAVVDPLLPHVCSLFMSPKQLSEISETYGVPTRKELGAILPVMYRPHDSSRALPPGYEIRKDFTLPSFENMVHWRYKEITNEVRRYNYIYAEESQTHFSFLFRVISGTLFFTGFSVFYSTNLDYKFYVQTSICLTVPGRFPGVKFARRLYICEPRGVCFVYFPRGVVLKDSEYATVTMDLRGKQRGIKVKVSSSVASTIPCRGGKFQLGQVNYFENILFTIPCTSPREDLLPKKEKTSKCPVKAFKAFFRL